MSEPIPGHLKLVADPSALGVRLFADWYRFGEPSGPVPLVYYVGGAISASDYRQREGTEPEPVVAQFRSALPLTSLSCVDLLVSSAPPLPKERATSAGPDFGDHLWSDLLPQTPNAAPGAVALVGYSFGGHLATYLALDSAEARALALIGAVGVHEATRQTTSAHAKPLLTRFFANHDDPAAPGLVAEIERVAAVLDCVPDRRIGRHDFRHYAENGAVRDAFAFVLAMLE